MSNTVTFVDPLGPVKAWLRQENLDGVGQRVYIGDPKGATLPYLAIMLVGGEVDAGEAPLATPTVQVCAQAATEEDAATAIWAAVSAIESLRATDLDDTVRCGGAHLTLGPIPRVDDAGPRYLAEFQFALVAR